MRGRILGIANQISNFGFDNEVELKSLIVRGTAVPPVHLHTNVHPARRVDTTTHGLSVVAFAADCLATLVGQSYDSRKTVRHRQDPTTITILRYYHCLYYCTTVKVLHFFFFCDTKQSVVYI